MSEGNRGRRSGDPKPTCVPSSDSARTSPKPLKSSNPSVNVVDYNGLLHIILDRPYADRIRNDVAVLGESFVRIFAVDHFVARTTVDVKLYDPTQIIISEDEKRGRSSMHDIVKEMNRGRASLQDIVKPMQSRPLSNLELADQLVEIADVVKTNGINEFGVKCIRDAAERIRAKTMQDIAKTKVEIIENGELCMYSPLTGTTPVRRRLSDHINPLNTPRRWHDDRRIMLQEELNGYVYVSGPNGEERRRMSRSNKERRVLKRRKMDQ